MGHENAGSWRARTGSGRRNRLDALLTADVSRDPSAQYPVVPAGQGAVAGDQQIELLPTQPIEVAVGVMGGDDDAAA